VTSGSGLNKWVWVIAIVLVFGFLMKDKLGFVSGNRSLPVHLVKEYRGNDLKGGPYHLTKMCSVLKDLVAMVDDNQTKILVMGLDGDVKTVFGKKGTNRSELTHISGICSDPDGNLYVLDHENSNVYGYHMDGHSFLRVDSSPTGYFYGPQSVAYAKGNFAIADTGSCRLVVINPAGKTVTQWSGRGEKPEQFCSPDGVAMDVAGHYVVSDADNKRIKVIDEKGAILKIIKLDERANAICCDGKNHVFVALTNSRFIQVFNTKTGNSLGYLKVENPTPDYYLNVVALSVVNDDKLVACDNSNIWVYQLSKEILDN
jgi:DNA-binding beta-propeller fold protein YncE